MGDNLKGVAGRQNDPYRHVGGWAGALAGAQRPAVEHTVVASFRVADDSGCQPFLGLCSDGKRYWVKHSQNAHGPYSLAAERVVAAVGKLIDAPVRPVALVDIPADLAFGPALKPYGVAPGVAHGSELLEFCQEKEELVNTSDDGNDGRQPKFMALWSLFLGEDGQWLYDSADQRCWSFDHGMWITGGDWGSWDAVILARILKIRAAPLEVAVKKMRSSAFLEVADALESLRVEDLVAALASVPVDWNVPDADLEALGWWLYVRREWVAADMRALSGKAKQ